MKTERFSVTMNVFVEATDEDEATLIIERLVRGVTLYNPAHMLCGVTTWLEIADLVRPRSQSTLF